jgi:hypothetical protein
VAVLGVLRVYPAGPPQNRTAATVGYKVARQSTGKGWHHMQQLHTTRPVVLGWVAGAASRLQCSAASVLALCVGWQLVADCRMAAVICVFCLTVSEGVTQTSCGDTWKPLSILSR